MTKTSDTIRQRVNDRRRSNPPSTTPVQKTQTSSVTTSKPSTLDLIRASTAMYRQQASANTNKPYTPSDTDKKNFETARQLVAEKRGIVPDKDGQYKPELLEKELSPLEIMKQLSFDHYRETKKNDKASEEINNIVQNVYTDEQEDQKEDIPQELTAINSGLQKMTTFYTLNDFLALNEKDQNAYLESISDYGAEKDFLTNELEKKAKSAEDEREAVKLKKAEKDPTGPKGSNGKDYSSKQTDIIQWMMEQILQFTDWCGNRLIDSISWPVYGALYELADLVAEQYKKFKEGLQSNSKKEDKQTPEKEPQNPPSLDSFINDCEAEKENLYKKLDEKPFEPGVTFMEALINHSISLDSDGFYQNGNKRNYSELSTNYSDEEIHDFLQTSKNFFDTAILKELKAKNNTDGNKDVDSALDEWYNNTTQNAEKESRGEKPETPDFPDILTNIGLSDEILRNHVDETRNQIIAAVKLNPIKNRILNSVELFATNYAMYKIIEDARSDESFNLANIEDLKSKYKKEGSIIMYQNYLDLRKGSKEAMSPEQMIEFSEEMYRESHELFKKGDKETQVVNVFETQAPSAVNDSSPSTLIEFSEKMTFNDWEMVERESLAALNREISILGCDINDNDDRRNKIKKIKDNISNRDERVNDFGRLLDSKNLRKHNPTPVNVQGNTK